MSDFRLSKLDDRYRNDAAFYQLVKAIENMIQIHGFSPSEIREACFLAHYKYEMENPKAVDDRFNKLMKVYFQPMEAEGNTEERT